MANPEVGDLVQIKAGGMDVTNGNTAIAGRYYGEGGPLWATVELIDYSWPAAYPSGTTVTKVRCVNGGVCVWQVQPQDIADNIMKANVEPQVEAEPYVSPEPEPEIYVEPEPESEVSPYVEYTATDWGSNSSMYLTGVDSDNWSTGTPVGAKFTNANVSLDNALTTPVQNVTSYMPNHNTIKSSPTGTWRSLNENERSSIGDFDDLYIDDSAISPVEFMNPYWDDPESQYEMLDRKYGHDSASAEGRRWCVSDHDPNHQNDYNYPVRGDWGLLSTGRCAEYDFQVHHEKDSTMQDMLTQVRAAFGIQVHGEADLEKAVKYYMYNRWKTPDTSLAHHKCFTHVFFTRPDCNLLTPYPSLGIVDQAKNHTDTALIWRRYPELFKLLTDRSRINDRDNFNLLLSNQVASFTVTSDTISTMEAGKSWGNHEISYGGMFTGRGAGELSCTFDETSDYAISNFMKLWITYIDNVSRGAWLPSYNLTGTGVSANKSHSHVYTKTLDYAASAYMVKVAPNGRDILYFTKYYGIFPTTTGSAAHSWSKGNNVGDTPQLDISFRYSFKRDMSLVSLLEFNHNANYSGSEFEAEYDLNHFGSARPFVGTPYVAMSMVEPGIQSAQMTNRHTSLDQRARLQLKFRPIDQSTILSDNELYKARW